MGDRGRAILLRDMESVLYEAPYGCAVWMGGVLPFRPFATVVEDEGLTVVTELEVVRVAGLSSELWTRSGLTIPSDLASVGLTAAIDTALAAKRISADVIAGFRHDHIFVQRDRCHDAMTALRELSRA